MTVAVDQPPEPFALVGQTLGGTYQIDGVIGSGAHGVLLSARHLVLGCRAAIKVLPPPSAARREPLLTALSAVAGLSHPNLVSPRDLRLLDDGSLLLAYPLLEGEDLASRVALRGRLSQAEGLVLLRQACAGLLALHRRGLAHGNLTPSNVFFARYDDVAIDNALGNSGGAQQVLLLDMALSMTSGPSPNAAEDQRALALLVRQHLADLTPGQMEALDRAADAKPKRRFASVQDLWKALLANSRSSGAAPEVLAETEGVPVGAGALGGASSQTAVVQARKARAGGGARAAHTPAQLRRLVLVGCVVALAVALGGSAALWWKRSQSAAPVAPPLKRPVAPAPPPRPAPPPPRPAPITLRVEVTPADAQVQVGDQPVPATGALQLPRGKVALELVARAPGYLEYRAVVTPDQDRSLSIALLKAPLKAEKKRGKGKRRRR